MIPRAIATFLGAFTLINVLGNLFARHFDCSIWWIDLRPLPAPLCATILLITAIVLLAYGLNLLRTRRQRQFTAFVLALVAFVTLVNAINFYRLLHRGEIITSLPVPLSLLMCILLTWIAWRAAHIAPAPSWTAIRPRIAFLLTLTACVLALPLGEMFFFGKTDYRRRADAAVVFGARAYADGHASLALSDRVQTACALYRDGLVPRLVFSGGPGDGSVSEPQAMRRLALRQGVPDSSIILDEQGLNTDATVRNTDALFRAQGIHRVLAVSHAYHLPRVKMAYRRAGREVYTVPARETRPLARMPVLVTREVAAVWAYYVAPIVPLRH